MPAEGRKTHSYTREELFFLKKLEKNIIMFNKGEKVIQEFDTYVWNNT